MEGCTIRQPETDGRLDQVAELDQVRVAVGDGHDKTTGSEHTLAFAGRGLDVGHVIEHVRGKDEVEPVGPKGKALRIGLHAQGVADMEGHAGGKVQRHPLTVMSTVVHCLFVGAVSAAHVEDALAAAGDDAGEIEDSREQIEVWLTAA